MTETVIESELVVESTDSVQENTNLSVAAKIAKYSSNNFSTALQHFEGIRSATAKRLVDYISTEITAALIDCRKVYIKGIGCIYLVYYPSRPGRHPRTGETIIIDETLRVKFRPSSLLTKLVNQNIKAIKKLSDIEDGNLTDGDESPAIYYPVDSDTEDTIEEPIQTPKKTKKSKPIEDVVTSVAM